MLTEKAMVIAVDGERALLETTRQSACGHCSVNKACGTGVIAKALGAKRFRIEAQNSAGARVGDEVVVAIEDSLLVKSSLLVYALPLLTMLAGGMLGEGLRAEGGEGLTILLALLGLALGFVVAARHAAGKARKGRMRPVILSRSVAPNVCRDR
ncbi:MAG: SoxR reducing system RseC family protein [Gammaproteobacteria bacterium]